MGRWERRAEEERRGITWTPTKKVPGRPSKGVEMAEEVSELEEGGREVSESVAMIPMVGFARLSVMVAWATCGARV